MYYTVVRDDNAESAPVIWAGTYVDHQSDAVMGADLTFFGLAKGRYTHYRIYVRDMTNTPRPHTFALPSPVDVPEDGAITLADLKIHIGTP